MDTGVLHKMAVTKTLIRFYLRRKFGIILLIRINRFAKYLHLRGEGIRNFLEVVIVISEEWV